MTDQINQEMKTILEAGPVSLATVMPNRNPNVIGVAFVKVVENQVVITDCYMNQTIIDISNNPNVVVLAWNQNMSGFKFIGKAIYHKDGLWLEKVKNIPENKGLSIKGAILVSVEKIIKTPNL